MEVIEEVKSQRVFTIKITEDEATSILAALLQAKFDESSEIRRISLRDSFKALNLVRVKINE